MRFFAIATALVSVVVAEKFTVIVAENGGLTYTPPSVTAKVGDTIAFQFQAGNHTVTQSTFANPCTPMTTPAVGIDSGFLPVAAGATQFPEWSFTIDNASAPLWFFCNRPPHCSRGMVFALNPTPERTYDAFLVRIGHILNRSSS
ncbi:Cupredoxin [Crucibulum laeve]|uniref:Cupredoxin n=1 Tax=Crucibulum laeve TaxID=68775 RepID=A0A5C3MAR8_9AGAR|nr:Cupredoxin [Crucibulum laeve]